MPFPMEYRVASRVFDDFLGEVAAETGLTSRHQAYTTTQGVLLCLRRRLTVAEAIAFAQVLPAMLRALFVQDWDADQPPFPSWDRAAMIAEVRQLRPNHNFSPDTAIRDVARVLRRYVEAERFERCLTALPPEVRAFWSTT